MWSKKFTCLLSYISRICNLNVVILISKFAPDPVVGNIFVQSHIMVPVTERESGLTVQRQSLPSCIQLKIL